MLVLPIHGCLKVDLEDTTAPGEATAPTTVEEVLGRYVTALGGETKLRALAQRTVDARVRFPPEQPCEEGDEACLAASRLGTFVLKTTADGRLYRRMVIDPLESDKIKTTVISERGFDGTEGWELSSGTPPLLRLDGEGERSASLEDATLHWYLDWSARGIAPTLQAPRRVEWDGKEHTLDGVEWSRADGKMQPRTYWFDRETGLLREEVEIQEGEGNARRTIVYQDYRDVDGTKVPYRIEQILDVDDTREVVELTVQRVTHDAFDAAVFAIPKIEAPAPIQDERVIFLEQARTAAKASPSDVALTMQWARLAWEAAHFDEVEVAAKAVLAKSPREPEAMWMMGRLSLVRGKLDDAERWLKKAEKAGASPAVIARVLAVVSARKRDFATAAKRFDAAGIAALARRYEGIDAPSLAAKWTGDGCTAVIPLDPKVEQPVLQVDVEGETLKLLLDTSVPDLVIDPARARKLLVVPSSQMQLMEGGPVIAGGQVDTIQLDTLTLSNVPVDIYPMEVVADVAAGRDIQGVLGTRPFLDTIVIIDRAANEIELVRKSPKCKKAGRHQGRALITMPMAIHDTHLAFVFGRFGAAEAIFLVNTAIRDAGLAGTASAFARAGVAPPVFRGDDVGGASVAPSVELGGQQLGPMAAAWGWGEQAQPGSGEFRIDAMLGLSPFGKRLVVLDFVNAQFSFEAGAPAPAATPAAATAATPPAGGSTP